MPALVREVERDNKPVALDALKHDNTVIERGLYLGIRMAVSVNDQPTFTARLAAIAGHFVENIATYCVSLFHAIS